MMSDMEIWKDVEGYEGLYQVSNMGRVKSLKYDKEKIIKSCKNSRGYLIVNLYKDKKMKDHKVHRLVAQAFLPNPNNLPQVNHKNEIKTDNRVDNLEYCDSSYNNNYGSRTERAVKAKSKPVLQFTKDGEFIRKWESATQVSRELGFNQSSISNCCKGKIYKSVGGYKWCYAVINGFTIDINKLKKVV